jgi:hypothetical protein
VSFWEIGVWTDRVNGFIFLNLKPKERRFLNSNRGFSFGFEGRGLNRLTIPVLYF